MVFQPYRLKYVTHFIVIALLIAFVVGLIGTANAQTSTTAQPQTKGSNGIISSTDDGVVSLAADRPWTRAELLAAKPLDQIEVKGDAGVLIELAKEPKVQGKPGLVLGAVPANAPKGQGEQPTGDVGTMSATAVPTSWYGIYPYTAVGRLFFRQYGVGYSCSAAVIKNRSIWTAGHCVHAGNNRADGWSTNVVFIPQYLNGGGPLGQWSVPVLWTTWDWYINGNPNGLDQDYAGGQVTDQGQPIGFYTGWLGFAWNQPYNQFYTAVGYPAGAPFNGLTMQQCQNWFARTGFGAPLTYSIRCNMTGGSSGGPWITSFSLGSAGAVNYLNGNTSYFDSRFPGELFSPYFDTNTFNLFAILPS